MCICTHMHMCKDMHQIVNRGSPWRLEYENECVCVCVWTFIFYPVYFYIVWIFFYIKHILIHDKKLKPIQRIALDFYTPINKIS